MNRWRIAGLVVLAVAAASLLAWHFLRSPAAPPVMPAPQPTREVFHASKPLRVQVTTPGGAAADAAWLEYELRQLLRRGKMHVVPVNTDRDVFTLHVELEPANNAATVALIAPDRIIEKKLRVAFPGSSRLDLMRELAAQLPALLSAPRGSSAWFALLGTDDERAYESYLSGALSLLGPAGEGFTRPAAVARQARTVERLETLVRREPGFARAWAALATGYLSLGGKDHASLAELAQSSAERALALDEASAEAHAALGLVHLRRSEWIAAREQFDRALTLDANSAPALEGSGCLLVDAGRFQAARELIERAIALQPANLGALECLAYVRIATENQTAQAQPLAGPAARVQALAAILAGDHDSARRYLRSSVPQQTFGQWADPLLHAAAERQRITQALQAITVAANEGHIDAATEILCGIALRRAEFVFNRMSRLQREREAVPLRVLWLPQTGFLRRHARFEQIVGASGLSAFWQEYGAADVCASEPAIYGCKIRMRAASTVKTQ